VNRRAAGLAQLALIGLIVGGLGVAAVTGLAYWRGDAAGAARTAAERNAHWQAVTDKMQAQARAEFEAARVAAERESAALTKDRDDAQANLNRERARTQALRGDLDRVVRDADRMREQLAAVASGGVSEDQDSIAACRARADAIGRVLGQALRTSEQCALDAEDLAAGDRALRNGWPEVTP
jgi:hypothetical protein